MLEKANIASIYENLENKVKFHIIFLQTKFTYLYTKITFIMVVVNHHHVSCQKTKIKESQECSTEGTGKEMTDRKQSRKVGIMGLMQEP